MQYPKIQLRTPLGRVRLDWDNIVTLSRLGFTPYAEISYLNNRIKDYSENTGAFPITLSTQKLHQIESRFGLNTNFYLSQCSKMIATLESIRNLKNTNGIANGQVIGLYGFTFPRQHVQRSWVHGALGFEMRSPKLGIANLFLNTASRGQDPKYWVSATYRIEF